MHKTTERPTNSIFLYSSTKSFKKRARSFARSLQEVFEKVLYTMQL